MREYTLNNAGNDQDVSNTINCNWKNITIADLEAGIADEKAHHNRSTRIKLMERSIKKKNKEALDGSR